MKWNKQFLIILSLILFCSTEGIYSQDILERKIDSIFQQFSPITPGIAFSLIDSSEVIYSKGFGSAQLEYNIPIDEETVFHIASDSKRFTALAILLLAEQNKLALSDAIHQYIPELTNFGRTITIQHLLNHTSGLRDQWQLLGMAGMSMEDIITKEHILKLVFNQKELNFSPNEEFTYCNTGYTLLAEIVERVSGQSFEEFTKTNIFQPLNMTNTHFHTNHKHIVPNRAYSYSIGADSLYQKEILNFSNAGATGLFTTVKDLQNWLVNIISDKPKVGSKEIFAKMCQKAVLNNGEETMYGMGEMTFTYNGMKLIGHGGNDAGFNSFVGFFPDYNIGVIALCNVKNVSSGNLALQAVDLYMENRNIKIKKEPQEILPTDSKQRIFIRPSDDDMTKQTGVYETVWGVVHVKNIDGDIYFKNVGEESAFQLFKAESRNQYYNEEEELSMTFSKELNEAFHKLKITGPNNTNFSATRIYPVKYSTDDLKEFVGLYISDELSTSYNIILKTDTLVATHSRHDDIPLSVKSMDRFTGNKWFFDILEFVRNDQNEIVGVLISGGRGRVKDIRFDKVSQR